MRLNFPQKPVTESLQALLLPASSNAEPLELRAAELQVSMLHLWVLFLLL